MNTTGNQVTAPEIVQADSVLSALQFYRQIFGAAWITQGLAVAANLGIADMLADNPMSAEELAAHTRANSDALHRLLRALTAVGVFATDAQGQLSLTPVGELLRSEVSKSQRAVAIMMGAEFYEAWGTLLDSVRTGEPGFNKKFGASFFDYMMEHADRHRIYDAAMTGVHGEESEPILDAYDFTGFREVVDVGGGQGLLLASLLNRNPNMRGILFDLPSVAERAKPMFASMGLESRCRVEGGDFLRSVPRGADAYILRHVIHDWEHADAVRILRNCRKAMDRGGKLLVVEMVIPPGDNPAFAKWLDLMMLLVGGRERTQDEYSSLFAAAGLLLNRVVRTASEICILETSCS